MPGMPGMPTMPGMAGMTGMPGLAGIPGYGALGGIPGYAPVYLNNAMTPVVYGFNPYEMDSS